MKQIVDVVEIGEIRIHLYHPIWRRQDNSANVEVRNLFGQKRLILHPGNDIVHDPREVQEYRRDAEVPSIDGWGRENERSMGHSENQFDEDKFVQKNSTAHV